MLCSKLISRTQCLALFHTHSAYATAAAMCCSSYYLGFEKSQSHYFHSPFFSREARDFHFECECCVTGTSTLAEVAFVLVRMS